MELFLIAAKTMCSRSPPLEGGCRFSGGGCLCQRIDVGIHSFAVTVNSHADRAGCFLAEVTVAACLADVADAIGIGGRCCILDNVEERGFRVYADRGPQGIILRNARREHIVFHSQRCLSGGRYAVRCPGSGPNGW